MGPVRPGRVSGRGTTPRQMLRRFAPQHDIRIRLTELPVLEFGSPSQLVEGEDEALPLRFQKLQVGSHGINVIIGQRDETHLGHRGKGPLDPFCRPPQDFRRRTINSPGVDPVTGSASHPTPPAARWKTSSPRSITEAGAGVATSEEPHARKRECAASSPAMAKHLSDHIAVLPG